MDYLTKQGLKIETREQLRNLKIKLPQEQINKQIQENWDTIAKPIDSLGDFESMIAKIGAIQGTVTPRIAPAALLILCADNGIVEEGISQSGQEVTAAVARTMGRDASSVGKMARVLGVDTIPVDIGINSQDLIPGLLNRRIRSGTRNFHKEPAMTEQEVLKALTVGIQLVERCREKGYQMLAVGEMGIGNTTTSSAVAAALLHCPVSRVTGRGAGLSDDKLEKKRKLIEWAIKHYDLDHKDAFEILCTVGGFDLAGLAGICIGGALYHMPVVLDGVISGSAALLAERMVPGTKEFLLASHKGKEPALTHLLKELGLTPVMDANMALGEGTGAIMLFPLLQTVMAVYQGGEGFTDMGIEAYKRY